MGCGSEGVSVVVISNGGATGHRGRRETLTTKLVRSYQFFFLLCLCECVCEVHLVSISLGFPSVEAFACLLSSFGRHQRAPGPVTLECVLSFPRAVYLAAATAEAYFHRLFFFFCCGCCFLSRFSLHNSFFSIISTVLHSCAALDVFALLHFLMSCFLL